MTDQLPPPITLPKSYCDQDGCVKDFPVLHRSGNFQRVVRLRWDDTCRNGYNTFSWQLGDAKLTEKGLQDTGALWLLPWQIDKTFTREEAIRRMDQDLRDLEAYHLFSANGPLHYLNNTIFLAGDRDCWGYRAGEHQKSKRTGKYLWRQASYRSIDPPETDTPDTPPPGQIHWVPVLGEGKARELDSARRSAIWPEATDEQLSSDPEVLREMLLVRLPALVETFKTLLEGRGFRW